MGMTFNGARVPQTAYIRFNGRDCTCVRFNGAEVWRRQAVIYPGTGVAKSENTGYPPYFTYSDQDGTLTVQATGGTEQGAGYVLVGPFSAEGFSRLFFDTLALFLENSFSSVSVSLTDADGVQLLAIAQLETGEAGGLVRTLTPTDVFVPPQQDGLYLRLEAVSGATHGGLVSRITLTGLILE